MERIKKENKEKIMDMIEKAGSEEYETSWNKGGKFSTSKKKSNIKRGKTSRAAGSRFELKVRRDLEDKGRVVDKWNNNVDLPSRGDSSKDDSGEPSGEPEEGKLIIAKRKFNPFSKVMTIGTGFPDFISIKHIHDGLYSVIGVEVKMNGFLSKIEKEKCAWYLKNKIFGSIWIAKAIKHGRKTDVEYIDFKEKYGDKYNKL